MPSLQLLCFFTSIGFLFGCHMNKDSHPTNLYCLTGFTVRHIYIYSPGQPPPIASSLKPPPPTVAAATAAAAAQAAAPDRPATSTITATATSTSTATDTDTDTDTITSHFLSTTSTSHLHLPWRSCPGSTQALREDAPTPTPLQPHSPPTPNHTPAVVDRDKHRYSLRHLPGPRPRLYRAAGITYMHTHMGHGTCHVHVMCMRMHRSHACTAYAHGRPTH